MKPIALAMSLVAVAAFGCGDDEPAANAPAPKTVTPSQPVTERAPIPPQSTPTPVTTPGAGYFGVDGTGVVRLQDGVFTRVLENRYKVRDMAADSKGRVWVAAIGGVFRIDGDRALTMGSSRAPGSIDRIDVGPKDEVWAIGMNGVSHFDGTSWTVEPKSAIGTTDLLRDIAVDDEGKPWLLTTHHVHTRDDGAWRVVDTGDAKPDKTFYQEITRGPDGTIYAASSSRVLARDGDKWRDVDIATQIGGIDHFDVGPEGRLHGIGGVSAIYLRPPGGGTIHLDADSGGFKAKFVRAVAGDDSGRTWLGTDYGVVVLSKDGGALAQWLPGAVKELNGSVDAMLFIAGGPELPEVGPQAKGHVRGRILKRGAGVANAEVEICESPGTMFQSSPCDTAVFKQRLVTGPEGGFQFEHIPVGTYSFAIRPTKDSQWLVMLGSNCCGQLEHGKVFDIGTIDISQ